MRDFTKYSIWQESHRITLDLYQLTNSFPKSELYGIISQVRRAASSIPTNIAEGCGRDSDADFKRFLTIASGSASELLYLLILSRDIDYLSHEEFDSLERKLTPLRKSIHQLIKKLGEEG